MADQWPCCFGGSNIFINKCYNASVGEGPIIFHCKGVQYDFYDGLEIRISLMHNQRIWEEIFSGSMRIHEWLMRNNGNKMFMDRLTEEWIKSDWNNSPLTGYFLLNTIHV